MFEDSLFESQVRAVSPRGRWTTAASIVVQAAVASLLVVVPLLHQEAMPTPGQTLNVTVPLHPPPPPPPRTVAQRASSAMASMVPVLGRMLVAPRMLPQRIDTSPAPETAATSFGPMGAWTGFQDVLGSPEGTPSRVTVAATPEKKTGPVRVSAGVVAGLLLAPIRPVYPAIAKAAHVEGTVVVEAVISKAGAVESLRVVSGPAMLQAAALEAIRAARYQPFQLNGELTEVRTTITVNFRMGG